MSEQQDKSSVKENPQSEKVYTISQGLLENLVAYMANRPYRESAAFIQALANLPEQK